MNHSFQITLSSPGDREITTGAIFSALNHRFPQSEITVTPLNHDNEPDSANKSCTPIDDHKPFGLSLMAKPDEYPKDSGAD